MGDMRGRLHHISQVVSGTKRSGHHTVLGFGTTSVIRTDALQCLQQGHSLCLQQAHLCLQLGLAGARSCETHFVWCSSSMRLRNRIGVARTVSIEVILSDPLVPKTLKKLSVAAADACETSARGHSISSCEEAVDSSARERVLEEPEAASGKLTRALSMAQADLVRSGGGQDGGDEYVTAVASSSSSLGREASKYVTASIDEEQIAAAIAKSREDGWSEVADHVREGAAGASWSEGLSEADRVLWEKLKEEAPLKFKDLGARVKLGRVIAEGGQAHIYEASIDGDEDGYVAKVFKMEGFLLADLHRQWPRVTNLSHRLVGEVVFGDGLYHCSNLFWGTFLKDGRFALVGQKYWGDLRTLVRMRLVANNYQGPPFSLPELYRIFYDIAGGMQALHRGGVLHRDLKAANVLIYAYHGDPRYSRRFHCDVADYESSMLVQGTGFWRAPEVLEDLLKKPCERNKEIWTEKVDVYGYAMTCYEVLTGHTPFEGYKKSDWKRVIEGERPHLPDHVDCVLGELVERCWHKLPSERPTFDYILSKLPT